MGLAATELGSRGATGGVVLRRGGVASELAELSASTRPAPMRKEVDGWRRGKLGFLRLVVEW